MLVRNSVSYYLKYYKKSCNWVSLCIQNLKNRIAVLWSLLESWMQKFGTHYSLPSGKYSVCCQVLELPKNYRCTPSSRDLNDTKILRGNKVGNCN